MHSSISSSDAATPGKTDGHRETAYRRLPHLGRETLLAALAVFAFFVVAMEVRLKARGIQPTAVDSEALWVRERERASWLGTRAVILIGASRMQTGIDLDALRARTGLEPVQLAIDASSFIPVLHGLAKDPAIRGTVIVSFSDADLDAPPNADSNADRYQASFERHSARAAEFAYLTIEGVLTDIVRDKLRSYADGARPLTSLLTRILPASITPQYVFILPDRSRLADYSHADVPTFYYNRVIRELGENVVIQPGAEYRVVDAQLRQRIEALAPKSDELYLQRAASVAADAATIEERGGRVYFVVMPTSGLITMMEDKWYPRETFWNRFVATTHSRTLHFEDVPSLKGIPVPDGSHVDYRNRTALTAALLEALDL